MIYIIKARESANYEFDIGWINSDTYSVDQCIQDMKVKYAGYFIYADTLHEIKP
jgi:hypothetical protein